MRSDSVSCMRPIIFGSSTEGPSPGRSSYISPTLSPCSTDGEFGWVPQHAPSLDLTTPGVHTGHYKQFSTAPESPGCAPSHLPPITRDQAAEPRILAKLRAKASSMSPYVLNPVSDGIDLDTGIEGTQCRQTYLDKRIRISSQLPHPPDAPPCRPHHARRRSAGESANSHSALTRCILLQPYEDLEDRYELGGILGDGMTGVVRRCREKNNRRMWACKTIAKVNLLCKEDVDALKMEIAAMTTLANHGSVVRLHDVLEDEKNVRLIMQLCNGGELFNCIIKRKRYPERDAAHVVRAILSVLHFMNTKGLMHRDIKPENVVLTHRDSYTNVRVIDFGQAVRFRPGKKLSAFVGSAYYVSPEVLNRSYGPEADMWSLGVLSYVLLCGSPPFWAKEREDIFAKIRVGEFDLESTPWNGISEGCKDLVKRMLTMSPAERITPLKAKRHPWILQFCPIKLPPTEPLFAQPPPSSIPTNPTIEGVTSPRVPNLPPTSPGSGKMSPRLPPLYYQKSGTRKASGSGPMPAGKYQLSEQEWSRELRSNQRRFGLHLGARRGQSLTDLMTAPQQSISTFGSFADSPTATPNGLSPHFSSTSPPSPVARSLFPESFDGRRGGAKPECLLPVAQVSPHESLIRTWK